MELPALQLGGGVGTGLGDGGEVGAAADDAADGEAEPLVDGLLEGGGQGVLVLAPAAEDGVAALEVVAMSVCPSSPRTARSSGIGTLLWPLTLIPRSSAAYFVVMTPHTRAILRPARSRRAPWGRARRRLCVGGVAGRWRWGATVRQG